MTTEREQLELAAKACGMPEKWSGDGIYVREQFCEAPWNPLRSDGDCARMENALGIDIIHTIVSTQAVYDSEGSWYESSEYFKDHNGDKNAARRAASVAVAAEIGMMK